MESTELAFGIGDTVKVETPYDQTRTAVIEEYFPMGAGRVPTVPRWRVSHADGKGGYYAEEEMKLVKRADPVAPAEETAAKPAKGRKKATATESVD